MSILSRYNNFLFQHSIFQDHIGNNYKCLVCLGWTHEAAYRGYGYVPLRFGGGTSLGEWEHNNILCVFIFQIILIFDFFFSLKLICKDKNKPTTFINIFTKLLVFESKHLFQI